MKVWINLNGNKRKRTFTPSLGITLYGVREGDKTRARRKQLRNYRGIQHPQVMVWFQQNQKGKGMSGEVKDHTQFYWKQNLSSWEQVRTGSEWGGQRRMEGNQGAVWDYIRSEGSRAKWRDNKDNHVCLERFGLLGKTTIRIMHNKNYAQHEDTGLDGLSGNRQYSVLILIFLKLSRGHLSWWKHSLGSLGGAVSGYQECLFVFLNCGVDMVMTSERPTTQGSQC